jgi:hypothetical protein
VLLIAGGLVWWSANNDNKKPSAPTSQPAPAPTVTQADIQKNLDAYHAVLKAAKVDLIKSISVGYRDGMWTATLTVKDIWHLRHKQLRLQDAQNLWKAWAVIASPKDLDQARIKLVDENDNEVGGSRVWGGSMIWVQD